MQRDFTPTRTQNACSVCGDETGRCRETDWGLLCMNIHAGESPGYKLLGLTDNGHWARWIRTDEDDRASTSIQEREERQRIKLQRFADALLPRERHTLYTRLLEELELEEVDRVDLAHRGLSPEEIELGGFKSVRSRHPLAAHYNPGLPGIAPDGRSLTNQHTGYLCPVRNARALIVGFQLRKREGGYAWLSGRIGVHLPIGELPLSVCQPRAMERSSILALTEGIGCKPFITAQRLGCVAIGASGGAFGSSSQTFMGTLEHFSPSEVWFFPDAGSVINPLILVQYKKAFALLQESTAQIQIGWWNQIYKDKGDVDELADHSNLKFIGMKDFWLKATTIALARYQAICKGMGVRADSGSRDAIELLTKTAELSLGQDLIQCRDAIARLMADLDIGWEHPAMMAWLSGREQSKLMLKDLINLKSGLESTWFSINL